MDDEIENILYYDLFDSPLPFAKNERFVICDVRTPLSINFKRRGSDYIERVYSGGDYEFVKKKDFNKVIIFKSLTYASKVMRKIHYDCDFGSAGINLKIVPLSYIGKVIDFK